jgi:hypothetical protein
MSANRRRSRRWRQRNHFLAQRKRKYLFEPLEPRTSPSSSFAGLAGPAGAVGGV